MQPTVQVSFSNEKLGDFYIINMKIYLQACQMSVRTDIYQCHEFWMLYKVKLDNFRFRKHTGLGRFGIIRTSGMILLKNMWTKNNQGVPLSLDISVAIEMLYLN